MPRNPLAAHPPWRQLLIISVVLPVVVVGAVLAYAWPVGRIAPRDLPVGIVGTGPASQHAVVGLDRARPGGFDFHLYPDQGTARSAIRDREVYGAFVVTRGGVTVLEAGAAGPTVAGMLTTSGRQLAAKAAPTTGGPAGSKATVVDVVPLSSGDPKGIVLSSALLPLTICSILVAAAVSLLLRFRPVWRQLFSVTVVSVVAGTGAYLITQGFLGALPGQHLATWGALALTVLSVAATTAGLISLLGMGGLALGAVLMVFVGNPFSGVSSAPQLLPDAVDHLGQWLPPGAGASLLRSTAYFDGNGAAGHLTVLLLWTVLGLAGMAVGQRRSHRVAAHAVEEPAAVAA